MMDVEDAGFPNDKASGVFRSRTAIVIDIVVITTSRPYTRHKSLLVLPSGVAGNSNAFECVANAFERRSNADLQRLGK